MLANNLQFSAYLTHCRNLIGTNPNEAIATLEILESISPGNGEVFTLLTLGRLSLKDIIPQRRRYTTCNLLGQWGRFGNQVNQYMTLMTMSAEGDTIAVYPDWIGSIVFAAKSNRLETNFKPLDKEEIDAFESTKRLPTENFDIGTYQAPLRILFDNRVELRRLLSSDFSERVLNEIKSTHINTDKTIAVHIRGTDYKQIGLETKIPEVRGLLTKLISNFPKYTIVIVTDDREMCGALFNDLTCEFHMNERYSFSTELAFFYDWILLRESAVAVYSLGSTFSSSAFVVSRPDQWRLFV